jgi:5-keto 4-deoxyuronate isomerase
MSPAELINYRNSYVDEQVANAVLKSGVTGVDVASYTQEARRLIASGISPSVAIANVQQKASSLAQSQALSRSRDAAIYNVGTSNAIANEQKRIAVQNGL